ncbi:prephenate dehydrogenase dimerization domain-containing protein [Streptomyces sp. WMMC940]|uniref:prephenate dehydrogenase dimerization domain-containing protein n=1 Tax=Streptomyces sp. WMMC940 TaxID=3015153 RepID=UPI0022B5F105|nr:prephenate dehydrogenase dimerization domain-containing protein [Streptomyces sp. WMMC940]MCZ7460341.1 prephenate dehydrogenase/arogenate dehydrogenase family protein [Streptomyces sp. WMMC940]
MSAAERSDPAIRRCVVAGGSGAVGQLFTALLADFGRDVCVVDPEPLTAGMPGVRHLKGDIAAPGRALSDELAATDLLLLAVPESVALAAMPALADALPSHTLLADTLSVKSRIAAAVADHAPGLQSVGLNPMFAPSLGVPGRPVASVVLHGGPLVEELLDLVAAAGGRIVRMDAERHDRLAAASQALTHATVLAFGQALSELDVDIEELAAVAPPPHATLLALLARIASGTPEVYWDVQFANPLADCARDALARGVDRLRGLAREGDEEDFAHHLDALSGVLGDRLPHLRDLCADLFTRMPGALPATPEEAV